MSSRLVARQVLRESLRNREALGLVVFSCLAFGVVGLVVGVVGALPEPFGLRQLLLAVAVLFVPIVSLQVGFETIADRRQDGRLRLLLAQPVSRPALVLGSYVGKVLVLAGALLAGVLAALGAHAVAGEPEVPAYVGEFLLATILLGTAYVGLAIGTSAASRTTRWGTVTILGCYLLFLGPWRILPHAVVIARNGLRMPETFPPWVDLVAGLSPTVAFERLFDVHGAWFFVAERYTSPRFSVAVLLGWALLVPAVGLWRFVRTDL